MKKLGLFVIYTIYMAYKHFWAEGNSDFAMPDFIILSQRYIQFLRLSEKHYYKSIKVKNKLLKETISFEF